ncbi:PD-(D/E)XK nuclease family protein [Flavobacterium sp. CYK-55]|uniref:PD-(D/E)XK nuclease family protein n=1 Tax=Flavobacterium sp. CYK-55 TaxID=2835529 RepID=UPI001BCB4A16|nr:PD-(D/E)XK nuclease family protein [Flavobacterium sp. CYK-55]MBS7786038.1 PD-(D/E)XK nuclease family protein [Flavobacterium sp. CYK-55]
MTSKTFLDKIAQLLIDKYSANLPQTVVVLPNKRAKIFLIQSLKSKVTQTIMSPEIVSIEDFIQEISGFRTIDTIELLFEFYQVYLSVTPDEPQSFELYSNWAKTLLQDFNEIDRYLLDPDKILRYLDEIKTIEHWSVNVEQRTDLIEKYLVFWKSLPLYYHALQKHLKAKQIGYQGIIYRQAVNQMQAHFNHCEKRFLFAGFNALNLAEEKIVQYLLHEKLAEIYWDIDEVFLNDPTHETGLFIRKFKQNWPYYKSNPIQWISSEYKNKKNIQIIGTAKSIGQARIVGQIIERLQKEHPEFNLNKTAVVLGDETLLIPLLYSLPAQVDKLNITMGYSAVNNPVQILVNKWFKMHLNALSRSEHHCVFYYKDLLDVLTHPLVEPHAQSQRLIQKIKALNYTFITHKRLIELHPDSNAFFDQLCDPWQQNPIDVIERVSNLLQWIRNQLSDEPQDHITRAFLYAIFTTINKLNNYVETYGQIQTIDSLFAMYKQIIDLAEVSFEGEPLTGLQVMGILESRVLDFETVIITSVNEGKLPAGKSQQSFIPYDVKMSYELPTYKEKDAIYTYHFYHLLQRAQNVFLLYNTESDGFDSGEKSRFITQLEIEKQPSHILSHDIYSAPIPEKVRSPLSVPKSPSIIERLKEMALNGLYPSVLNSYIRNPMDFYFRKILRIGEVDEVEENIALNTLGTIIHETLRVLYSSYIGQKVEVTSLKEKLALIDSEVLNQFKEVYKEGEIKKGRNLLAFEVAKRNVYNFIQAEIKLLEQGDELEIIALEQSFTREFSHPKLPISITFSGNIDRVEKRNGRTRIIDYKTGKVDKNQLILSYWDDLTENIKNDKIIQILLYAYVFLPQSETQELEAGIISFKNLKAGFMPFGFKVEKEMQTMVNDHFLADFMQEIVGLLQEIFNPELPFEEKL